MKLVMIGPVYPYKGGISHYTSLMCQTLRTGHEVEMVSYKLQYPRLLFRKEQKDFSNKRFEIADTKYLIHTANPFNWIHAAKQIRQMNADAIIIQWWHPYFVPCYYVMTKLLKRTPILYVCHNVFPHERFPLDRVLCKLALRQGDHFIVQSYMDEEDLLGINAKASHVVTPLPTFNAFKIKDMSKSEARELLQMEAKTPMLLFFGFVREYKGLKYLLKALPHIREKIPDIRLWVVGDFGSDKADYMKLIEENRIQASVTVVEGYVPDQEVEKYFAASDLVVLPYISATQSAIAQIAYGFEKPVVVTNVGGLPDVVEDHVTGYVVEKEDEKALAEAVINFFAEDRAAAFIENIKNSADNFSWNTMKKRIESLLESADERE